MKYITSMYGKVTHICSPTDDFPLCGRGAMFRENARYQHFPTHRICSRCKVKQRAMEEDALELFELARLQKECAGAVTFIHAYLEVFLGAKPSYEGMANALSAIRELTGGLLKGWSLDDLIDAFDSHRATYCADCGVLAETGATECALCFGVKCPGPINIL